MELSARRNRLKVRCVRRLGDVVMTDDTIRDISDGGDVPQGSRRRG